MTDVDNHSPPLPLHGGDQIRRSIIRRVVTNEDLKAKWTLLRYGTFNALLDVGPLIPRRKTHGYERQPRHLVTSRLTNARAMIHISLKAGLRSTQALATYKSAAITAATKKLEDPTGRAASSNQAVHAAT